MAYTSIPELSAALTAAEVTIAEYLARIQTLEGNLGKFANVTYEDQSASPSSPNLEINSYVSALSAARYSFERLQVQANHTYATALGTPQLQLTDLEDNTVVYNIKKITPGAGITALGDGDYVDGYVYSFYYVANDGTGVPAWILYARDDAAINARLLALEGFGALNLQYIHRETATSTVILNPTVGDLWAQDNFEANNIQARAGLVSQNFEDDGTPNGTVSVQTGATFSLAGVANILVDTPTSDFHLVNRGYFNTNVDQKINDKFAARVVADTFTPAGYEDAYSTELEDGTIYLQLEA